MPISRTMHQMEMPPMVTAELTRSVLLRLGLFYYMGTTYWLNSPFDPVRRLISSSVDAAPMRLTT